MAGSKANVAGQSDKIPGQDATDGVKEDIFTVEILQLVKEAQAQHGLRHGDYQRYRQYCARRISRIRKSLHFPQGNKHRVQPKKVTEDLLKDVKYLLLVLVDAERAWSYSMQLKSEANTEPRKRFHMVSRLRKAVTHSESLLVLCNSNKCDARTKLEAEAYCSAMKGALNFEIENWKPAMECYSSAKTIYEKLGGALVDELREAYLQRVEEMSANIRYCAYKIGDDSAIDDLRQMRLKMGDDAMTNRLDELIEKTRERQAVTLSEVSWRGRTMPVRNEKVRQFLLSIQETEKQFKEMEGTEAKLSIYETLLKELIEAQQSLRDDFKDDVVAKSMLRGQNLDEKVPNSVYLHTYLSYLKLTKTVERNLLIVENIKPNVITSRSSEDAPVPGRKVYKPQDVARLYDSVIQSLSEILNLPGLQDDAALEKEVEVEVLGYKCYRAFYLGMSYALVRKYKEAVALYEQSLKYINQFKSSAAKYPKLKTLATDLGRLAEEVDGMKFSLRASSILDVEDLTDSTAKVSFKPKVPLEERLDAYVEDSSIVTKKPNLTRFPPAFEPIPSKPLFFNLALSHVEFPDLEDKVEQKKQGGGISGLVKGWLWGGGKK